VATGDVSGAGTDANVFITLFGEFGDSGEKKLMKSLTHMNKFERKNVDRFVVQSADLGPLFKIHIRHDNSSFSTNWFLDRVEVTDKSGERFLFLCERWLSKSKEDKKIERTLFEKVTKRKRLFHKFSKMSMYRKSYFFPRCVNIELQRSQDDKHVVIFLELQNRRLSIDQQS
jgi:hypothetical protein